MRGIIADILGDCCALVEPLYWVSQDKIAGCAEDWGLGESGTIAHCHGGQYRKPGQGNGPQSLLSLGLMG